MAKEFAARDCRFVRRMIAILGVTPDVAEGEPTDTTFRRLVKLEQQALEEGAPAASLHVIRYVRQTTWSFVVVSAMGDRAT
jgi:hypothetical protein